MVKLKEEMGSRALFLKGASLSLSLSYGNGIGLWQRSNCFSIQQRLLKFPRFSSKTTCSSLESPDVSRLAKTAQISLTPTQVIPFPLLSFIFIQIRVCSIIFFITAFLFLMKLRKKTVFKSIINRFNFIFFGIHHN